MIELSPYYFSSTGKNESFAMSYYPINEKWKIEIVQKNKSINYWLDTNQAKEIRDLLNESLTEIDKPDE